MIPPCVDTQANQAESIVRLFRPHQWTKNAVVLAGVVFSGKVWEAQSLLEASLATVAFCLASSGVYVFNDWHDRDEDRRHPTKRQRPIAAGTITTPTALLLAASASAGALSIGYLSRPAVASIIACYLGLMLVYTLVFRQLPVFDILTIAGGFVLRALAGAVAVAVPLSAWLLVCTVLLALLLGLGKRRHELRMLEGETAHHRPSLTGYAQLNLDRILIVTSACTLGAYMAYTIAAPSFGRHLPMVITAPFVAIALGRYLFLVLRRNLGGSPEWLLVRDRALFLTIVLWGLAVGAVLRS